MGRAHTVGGEGEIKGLYMLPTRHGQGIGRLLVAHAVDRLEQREAIKSLLIGCIRENPSCGFYRHLGGVEAFRRPNAVDNFQTEEIFFSWSDLSPFRLSNRSND
jgi:GNAT superfamily N-acetyltransferase